MHLNIYFCCTHNSHTKLDRKYLFNIITKGLQFRHFFRCYFKYFLFSFGKRRRITKQKRMRKIFEHSFMLPFIRFFFRWGFKHTIKQAPLVIIALRMNYCELSFFSFRFNRPKLPIRNVFQTFFQLTLNWVNFKFLSINSFFDALKCYVTHRKHQL